MPSTPFSHRCLSDSHHLVSGLIARLLQYVLRGVTTKKDVSLETFELLLPHHLKHRTLTSVIKHKKVTIHHSWQILPQIKQQSINLRTADQISLEERSNLILKAYDFLADSLFSYPLENRMLFLVYNILTNDRST